MKEIAVRCGCSVATVSKALNHMSDISSETAQRVRAVADEMGYTPNAAARTLKTNRSHVIGLLLFLREESVWVHDHFGAMASGIQSVTEAAGYDITPVNCSPETVERSYLDHCRYRGYDGAIIMTAGFDSVGLNQLVNSELPLVTIDYTFHNRAAVSSDNARGMADLTAHVLIKGHRRVAYICGEDVSVTQNRLASFYATCRRFGVDVPPEYIRPALYRDVEASAQATRELLALPEPPTCILYPDDYACMGGINVIIQSGLRIPEDVSVAGYDGVRMARVIQPRLTTLKQDSVGIGRRAGELIVKAIEYPREFVPEHVIVPGRLWPGETVADLTMLTAKRA